MNLIAQIAETVLNGFWQALALTFLVSLALRLLGARVNAATRHVIWWIALAAILVLPFIPGIALSAYPASTPRTQQAATTLPIRVAAPLVPTAQTAPFIVRRRRTAVWPYWLLGIWAAVFAREMLRILRGIVYLRAVKQRARVWERPLSGLTRSTHLLLSKDISSPIAVGFWHPSVVLPENLCERLAPGELDCVLLHEIAHLVRYDDWINLAARGLGAVVALHPAALWILGQIEREREIACDDWAVAHAGAAHTYAESLARVVELCIQPAESLLAAGIFTNRLRLVERIELLLRRGREFSPAVARGRVGAAAFVMAVLVIAGELAPRWIVFAQRLEFEVVSVKHNTEAGRIDVIPKRSGDLVIMHNAQLSMIVRYAYRLAGAYQVVGLPEDDTDSYDIQARVGRAASEDDQRRMFQALLEDRFKFKTHRETREIPEYELTVVKGRPRLPPSRGEPMKVKIEGERFEQPPGTCGLTPWADGAHLICHAATMDKLLRWVSWEMKEPVADSTGLNGTYDVHIHYVPENQALDADAEPGASLREVLQADLGLKLVRGKGPVEVLVIDHLEKPSEN